MIEGHQSDGTKNLEFNNRLRTELEEGVYEINADDHAQLRQQLTVPVSGLKKMILFIPGCIGWLINRPSFLFARRTAIRRLKEPGHYDSVVMGILLLTYPLYVLLLMAILWLITHSWWSLLFPFFALFTAWAWVQVKPQLPNRLQ